MVCCGLSMGGYVLFELLRRHPARVLALILCDTKAEPDTAEARQGRDDLVALAEREGAGPLERPEMVNRVLREFLLHSPLG